MTVLSLSKAVGRQQADKCAEKASGNSYITDRNWDAIPTTEERSQDLLKVVKIEYGRARIRTGNLGKDFEGALSYGKEYKERTYIIKTERRS